MVVIVELFRLLSKHSKHEIAEQLSAWLIGWQSGNTPVDLGTDQLEALGDEMTLAWMEQASGHLQG